MPAQYAQEVQFRDLLAEVKPSRHLMVLVCPQFQDPLRSQRLTTPISEKGAWLIFGATFNWLFEGSAFYVVATKVAIRASVEFISQPDFERFCMLSHRNNTLLVNLLISYSCSSLNTIKLSNCVMLTLGLVHFLSGPGSLCSLRMTSWVSGCPLWLQFPGGWAD